MKEDFQWICKSFSSLKLEELYALGQLRQAVFVVEQHAPYLDFDGLDQEAQHILAYKGEELLAYARIIPPELQYPDAASIGRVCVAPQARGQQLGRVLMQKALASCHKLYGAWDIRISAQTYLRPFYESFGFVAYGPFYLEDQLPHRAMRLAFPL